LSKVQKGDAPDEKSHLNIGKARVEEATPVHNFDTGNFLDRVKQLKGANALLSNWRQETNNPLPSKREQGKSNNVQGYDSSSGTSARHKSALPMNYQGTFLQLLEE
jgi:hypothetical protein